MKAILILMNLSLVLTSTHKEAQLELSPSEVLDIFKGFFMGMEANVQISQLRNCLTDLSTSAASFRQAISYFELGTADGMKQGLSEVANGFTTLPSALLKCKAATVDVVQGIKSGIESFASPWSFFYNVGKNLIVNGQEIYVEVMEAVVDWQTGQWHDFGYNIGKAMYQVFLTAFQEGSDEGLGKGFAEGVKIKDLQYPLHIGSNTSQLIHVVDLFAEGNIYSVQNGFTELSAFVREFGEVCCESDDCTEFLQAAAEVMEAPDNLAVIDGNTVYMNGLNLSGYIQNAVSACKQGYWEICGLSLGQLVESVMKESLLIGLPSRIEAHAW